ncbi:hypothetical protein ACQ4PT_037314 [Festuca glaucescens]
MLVNTRKDRVTVQAHKIIVDPPIYLSCPPRRPPISSLSHQTIAASRRNLPGGHRIQPCSVSALRAIVSINSRQWFVRWVYALLGKTMRRYSPPYRSPPRRGYGGRGRSPPRRGYGGRREQSSGSLLVRNIPLSCRPDDLRVPFERFGPVRDVYLPKDYYSKQPRGFAFVEFVDPYDASEAQYHMNRQVFFGREITVVVAAESRKRPDDMINRARVRYVIPWGILVNMKGVILVMGGLVPVPVHAPTLLAIVAVLGQGRTLLLQDAEMTTLLLHQDHITHDLPDVRQKGMKTTSGGPIHLPVEVVASMMERGRHHRTVTDHLHAVGRAGNPQNHLRGHAQGPLMLLLPAATDRLVLSILFRLPARPCTLL